MNRFPRLCRSTDSTGSTPADTSPTPSALTIAAQQFVTAAIALDAANATKATSDTALAQAQSADASSASAVSGAASQVSQAFQVLQPLVPTATPPPAATLPASIGSDTISGS